MIDRDRESVARREAPVARRPGRSRSRAPQRLIPFLVLAFIAVVIARQEIPAVADWWEKTFSPAEWTMKQSCRQAAIEASGNRAFARLIETGDLHGTESGFYIERLVLGEMGPDGAEQRIEYSCYLSQTHELVRLNRLDGGAPGRGSP